MSNLPSASEIQVRATKFEERENQIIEEYSEIVEEHFNRIKKNVMDDCRRVLEDEHDRDNNGKIIIFVETQVFPYVKVNDDWSHEGVFLKPKEPDQWFERLQEWLVPQLKNKGYEVTMKNNNWCMDYDPYNTWVLVEITLVC